MSIYLEFSLFIASRVPFPPELFRNTTRHDLILQALVVLLQPDMHQSNVHWHNSLFLYHFLVLYFIFLYLQFFLPHLQPLPLQSLPFFDLALASLSLGRTTDCICPLSSFIFLHQTLFSLPTNGLKPPCKHHLYLALMLLLLSSYQLVSGGLQSLDVHSQW